MNGSCNRLQVLQERLDAFYDERDWLQFQTLKDVAASTAIEAAELQQLFLWQEDEVSVLRSRRPEVAAELADIFINVLNFARLAGIDLINACSVKLGELERRYPAGEVAGRIVTKGASG
jgi:NTP pyrophosphatase (non-canonical NTP hydrolase)